GSGMRRVVAPGQIAQRLGVGFGDGAQEAREDGLTIRGLREHLRHQFRDMVLAGRHRQVAMRPHTAIAIDEALLLQPGQDGVNRRQCQRPIGENLAQFGRAQPVVMDPDGVHDAAFEFTQCSHSSKVLVVAFSSVSPSISLHTVEFQDSGPGPTRESRRIATGRRARSRRGADGLSEPGRTPWRSVSEREHDWYRKSWMAERLPLSFYRL